MLIGVQLQLLQRICRTIIIEIVSFGVKIFSLMQLLLSIIFVKKEKKGEKRSYITYHFDRILWTWRYLQKKRKGRERNTFPLNWIKNRSNQKKYAITYSSINREREEKNWFHFERGSCQWLETGPWLIGSFGRRAWWDHSCYDQPRKRHRPATVIYVYIYIFLVRL